MSHDDDFADLMRAISEGDPAAFRKFVARYERDVQMMVRARLARRMRTQYDSVDFVQAVWTSFFGDLRDQPRGFDSEEHLRKFLAGVVRNKVHEQYRRLTRTEKYKITREQSLYIRRGEREVLRDLISPEPSPSEEVQGKDRLEQLIAGRTPVEVAVVTYRREGLTHEEIATRTGLNERTVRRIIEAMRPRKEARR
jgi:RNA polymerase sigma factor (sigma-70 family)